MSMTSSQRRTIESCRNFGGEAEECAEIAEYFSDLLDEADDKIAELNRQIAELTNA